MSAVECAFIRQGAPTVSFDALSSESVWSKDKFPWAKNSLAFAQANSAIHPYVESINRVSTR